jgi:hypothetical protein
MQPSTIAPLGAGDYAWGPVVILGGGALAYERGTPVVLMFDL